MTGLETASAAVTLVTLGKSALNFYQDARLDNRQLHKGLRLRLEIEAIIFDRWCSDVGIKHMINIVKNNTKTWQGSPEFEAFQSHLEAVLRCDHEVIATLIVDVLKDLNEKFENARGRIPKTSFLLRNLLHRRKLGGALTHVSIKEKESNLLRQVRWIAWDKKIFITFLQELTAINESLQKFLPKEQQAQIRRRINLEVLGNKGASGLATLSRDSSDPKDLGEIDTLASLKMMNVEESALAENDNQSLERKGNEAPNSSLLLLTGRVRPYQIDDFDSAAMKVGLSRVITRLDNGQVLIEWKYYSSSRPLRVNQILRLANLVVLLSQRNVADRFHIPHCKGFVQDEKNSRIGLVYEVQPKGQDSEQVDLQSHIKASDMAPLGHRFSMARHLSVALHYLQSIHWLHKALRSDNVVFFQRVDRSIVPEGMKNGSISDTQSEVDGQIVLGEHSRASGTPRHYASTEKPHVKGLIPHISGRDRSCMPPQPIYLLGLDLSRPDHPSERTETLTISTEVHRHKKENIELYSHPKYLEKDSDGKHRRFRSEFDIYSLGIILVEIGLWKTASSMKREAEKKLLDYRDELRTTYCDGLRSRMGEGYWRATQRCLNNDFDFDDIPKDAEEGLALDLAFEKQVVSVLEACKA